MERLLPKATEVRVQSPTQLAAAAARDLGDSVRETLSFF